MSQLAAVMTTYRGSDGTRTRELYAELEKHGPAGRVAMNLFRACKCSERAKSYRGRRYKDAAYGRKQWSLGLLCDELVASADALGIAWGWKLDPDQAYHNQVLYVDLPTFGQVSFHTAERLKGPDYPGEWCGEHGASPQRVCSFAALVLAKEA